MKLTGEQRDLVRSYAIHQDWQSLITFIEELSDGEKVDSVSDQASGGASSELGSPAGTEDTGGKVKSRRK